MSRHRETRFLLDDWSESYYESDALTAYRARPAAGRAHDGCVGVPDAARTHRAPALSAALKVVYHDACHLAHAQGVTAQLRQLLRAIPNLTLVETPEGEICCGSAAGTYNIEQPEIAARLGGRKAVYILESGADAVAAGNIGCLVQIKTHLHRNGHQLPLYHTVQQLDMAYTGQRAME